MLSNSYVNTFLFGIYPYLCLSILLIGSLIRFDREPYTWKSDSSQMLRKRQLRLGSNLFHYGVIIVILGHFAGFLAPHWSIDWALSPVAHQLLAMVVGGIAGLVAIVGLTILLVRRLGDARIRLNSRKWDIAVALMLWLQLMLGLLTVPLSAFHMDGALFEMLTSYVKGIVTLDGSASALMIDVPLTRASGAGASPAPSGAATTGSLVIDSRPSGARVIVDGAEVGVTPLTLPTVAAGVRQVRLELTGYLPISATVVVEAGERARFGVSLTPEGH